MGWLGWLLISVCILAAYLAFKTDGTLRIFTLINLITYLCSLGIMLIYGRGEIVYRLDLFATRVNLITSVIGVILLIIIVVFYYRKEVFAPLCHNSPTIPFMGCSYFVSEIRQSPLTAVADADQGED